MTTNLNQSDFIKLPLTWKTCVESPGYDIKHDRALWMISVKNNYSFRVLLALIFLGILFVDVN